MDMYDKKAYFVRISLKELLLAIDDEILDVYYYVERYHFLDCFSEYVVILNKSGSKIEILVTGDKPLTIAKKALNSIGDDNIGY